MSSLEKEFEGVQKVWESIDVKGNLAINEQEFETLVKTLLK